MKIEVNSFIYFRNLVNKLKDESTLEDVRNSVNEKIAAASRRFIKQGKVTPALEESTIAKKGHSTPLLDTGNLVNSIRATKKGIKYNRIGDYHRQGTRPYKIEPKNKKVLVFKTGSKSRVTNMYVDTKAVAKFVNHPGLPKREFIAWYADENEKRKIIRNVKRDLVKKMNKELRRK
tara:strand:- start:53 stop:580 length:528 start_codon:yes stop_codon:yes gene_type:complete